MPGMVKLVVLGEEQNNTSNDTQKLEGLEISHSEVVALTVRTRKAYSNLVELRCVELTKGRRKVRYTFKAASIRLCCCCCSEYLCGGNQVYQIKRKSPSTYAPCGAISGSL